MTPEELFALPVLADVKEEILSISEAAGLPARDLILGEPSERWIEISARVQDRFNGTITKFLITDPVDLSILSGREGSFSASRMTACLADLNTAPAIP